MKLAFLRLALGVSLNEAARLKEMKENKERVEARNKERKARHEPEEKVYELTLKQVDLPGLPPPVAKTNELSKAGAKNADVNATDDDDTDPEDKLPPVDVTLKETKRILLDLVALSNSATAVVVHN